MQHPSLETIAAHFLEPSVQAREDLSHAILEQVARGRPIEKSVLAAALHLSQEDLEQRLAQLPDLEVDQQGRIVGWGVTLVPTRHQFQMHGQQLFTWCAFDTVLYPPLLGAAAQVHSTCPVTGRSISFVATPEGSVQHLIQEACVLSLILSREQQYRGRAGFCERSLFFWDEQAATSLLASHPEAILLSIEEAAHVGKLVSENRANGVQR